MTLQFSTLLTHITLNPTVVTSFVLLCKISTRDCKWIPVKGEHVICISGAVIPKVIVKYLAIPYQLCELGRRLHPC